MVNGTVTGVLAENGVGIAFGIIEAIVFASWALMFAVLLGILVTVTVMRRRRLDRLARTPPAPSADPRLPALLVELRRSDPHFDPELLLEAAQIACLVMFAAQSTGDEQVIRHLAAPSFWRTFFGRYVRTQARDARVQRAAPKDPDRASSRQARLPVDYQATAPELIGLELGPQQRACVRVSFYQLRAVVAPGARAQTAMASATSLSSLAVSLGAVVGERLSEAATGPSWLSWEGQYDLAFIRPGGSHTDPDAAVASRTCTTCGATYRSELATTCANCKASRPLPWGEWRLADLTPVE